MIQPREEIAQAEFVLAATTLVVPPVDDPPPPGDTFTAWTYDPLGNRLTETSYLVTRTYAYDVADRLTGVTGPGTTAPTGYTYDANGNQTSAGATTYAYDLADRLVGASVGTTTETYSWSGDGLRTSAATGPQAARTVRFTVDRTLGAGSVVIERDGAGATLRRFTYGLDRLSQQAPTADPVYLHRDGLGSVTDLTGPAGTSLAWTAYGPFGAVCSAGAVAGAPASPFGFSGEYTDPTGLLYLRARAYDPGTGRFLSVDPVSPGIGDPSIGAYAYANGNPVRYTDPSGKFGPGVACLTPVTAPICVEALNALAGLAGAIIGVALGEAISQATQGPVVDTPGLAPPPLPIGTLQEPRPMPPPLRPPGETGGRCSGTGCRLVVVTGAGGVLFYYYIQSSKGAPFQPPPTPQPGPPPSPQSSGK